VRSPKAADGRSVDIPARLMDVPSEPSRHLAVALTGGIASGKSAIQTLFENLGAAVVDADIISRELVARGQPALAEIAETFGADALTSTGELDRARMRELVFSDSAARRKLESILHPRVRDEMLARARACESPYCLLAIPLLAESAGAYAWVDRVLTVDVPRSTQLQRLMRRDGTTVESAQRALDAQASRSERLSLADDVIDNTNAVEALVPIVGRLHRRYLAAAAQASQPLL